MLITNALKDVHFNQISGIRQLKIVNNAQKLGKLLLTILAKYAKKARYGINIRKCAKSALMIGKSLLIMFVPTYVAKTKNGRRTIHAHNVLKNGKPLSTIFVRNVKTLTNYGIKQ